MPRGKPSVLQLDYQKTGTQFLRRRRHAGLFDEQGLGKSKQVIDAISGEIGIGTLRGALIVCPNGLKSNWSSEIAKFSNLPCKVFGSGREARRRAFTAMQAAFYVINYEAIPAEIASLRALLQFKPLALILDESHRIKTPDAKVTKAIHRLRTYAARRYILTGTPVANKPDDLWSQMFFLDGGEALGDSFESFERNYKAGRRGYQRIDELRELIADQTIRRTKKESLKLPDKTYRRVLVPLCKRQQSMYETMRRELELSVRKMSGIQVLKQADAILARLVRLAQLASNPALLDAAYRETPAKILMLDALLGEKLAKRSSKVIVWTSFVENIHTLASRYSHHSPVTIFGDIDSTSRDGAIKAFREDRSVRLLIANPAAAREGLTLTEANVAIYLDRTFNLVDYLQSQDRIHRISQTKTCEIILLLAAGTVDEFIDFSLEQKHRLAQFAQKDVAEISPDDLALKKPDFLRALLSPGSTSSCQERKLGERKGRPAQPAS